jgi:hypothetical protein
MRGSTPRRSFGFLLRFGAYPTSYTVGVKRRGREVDHSLSSIAEGFFNFFGVGWDWVHLVRRPLIGLSYQPRTIDDECGAVGKMRIGRGNRSTRRKPASVPVCPPQIPHDLTRARTRAAAVENRRLTALVMARPCLGLEYVVVYLNFPHTYSCFLYAGTSLQFRVGTQSRLILYKLETHFRQYKFRLSDGHSFEGSLCS